MRVPAAVIGGLTLAVAAAALPGPDAAVGSDWRAAFDASCSQSNGAMGFPAAELKRLIRQCDQLRQEIEAEDETVRKVYLKRLQMCRNLYQFVLETKEREQQGR